MYKLSKYIIPIKELENEVILFNAVSGEVIKLNKDLYTILSTQKINEDISFFKELRQKRFIVPVEQDEFKLLRYNEITAQQFKEPTLLSYVIAPTSACNFRCVYCFEGNSHPNITMNSKTVDNIVNYIDKQLKLLPKIEDLHITWFGGEPLLSIEILIELGKKIKHLTSEHNIKFHSSIVTNGVFFTKENALALKETCNLVSAQITLDGMVDNYCKKKKASSKDFYTVLKNIKDTYHDIEIDVRLNTDKQNCNDMYSLVNHLYSEMGMDSELKVHMAQLVNYSSGNDDKFFSYEEYKEEADKFIEFLIKNKFLIEKNSGMLPCHKLIQCRLASKYNFAIGPQGELYKCEQYIGMKDKVVGSVTQDIYYNNEYFNSMMGVVDEKCETCSLYPVCNHYARCPQLHSSIVNAKDEKCSVYPVMIDALKKMILKNI